MPGIGEKGARDLITTWGSLDALLEHAPRCRSKKYREALLAHSAEARASRELLRDPHRRAGRRSTSNAFRYRGADRASAATSCSRRSAFRSLTMEYAPTADSDREGLRARQPTPRRSTALVAKFASAGRVALRVLPDQPLPMRAAIVGIALSTAARSARYIPMRAFGHRTLVPS